MVDRKNLSKTSKTLNGLFVLYIENVGTSKEVWRVNFVTFGHKDIMEKSFVHNISLTPQQCTEILVGMAVNFAY